MESSGRGQRVHIVNTFFYSKLLSAGYRGVERWIRKVSQGLEGDSILLLKLYLGLIYSLTTWSCGLGINEDILWLMLPGYV